MKSRAWVLCAWARLFDIFTHLFINYITDNYEKMSDILV